MSILSGFKRFKDYIKTDDGYMLSSRWTKSDAVVMGDGTDDENTVEKNLGAIKGITSDLSCEDEGMAASMVAVAEINESLNNITEVGGVNIRYNPETDNVEIFHNGVWNYWSPGQLQSYFLLKDGDILTDVTGGYTYYAAAYGSATYATEGEYYALSIKGSGSYHGSLSLVANQAVDLTKYSKLKMQAYTEPYSGVSVKLGLGFGETNATFNMTYTNMTEANGWLVTSATTLSEVEMDISALSGEKYLQIAYRASGGSTAGITNYAYIKRIWLE